MNYYKTFQVPIRFKTVGPSLHQMLIITNQSYEKCLDIGLASVVHVCHLGPQKLSNFTSVENPWKCIALSISLALLLRRILFLRFISFFRHHSNSPISFTMKNFYISRLFSISNFISCTVR